jgi:CheY-like chemotaxis protein
MILFVDDESFRAKTYVEELEFCDFAVVLEPSVDRALNLMQENGHEVDLLILDIMMDPGLAFMNEDTAQGLRTGLRFFERIREPFPSLPIIMLTNVSTREIETSVTSQPKVLVLNKTQTLPYELADHVRQILTGAD